MIELILRSSKFYKEKIGLKPTDFVVPRRVYTQLGQFDYAGTDYTQDLTEFIGTTTDGNKWIYIGQVKTGTEIADGIGIFVADNGDIYEGYWKNGEIKGYGRYIWPDGDYYIGMFKDNGKHGQGEYHWSDGKVYKGQYENEDRNGQGTMTYSDGTKKSGEWKDDKFQG